MDLVMKQGIWLVFLVASGGLGCAAEVGPGADHEGAGARADIPSDERPHVIASVEHGESTVEFFDVGEGGVGVGLTGPMNQTPLHALAEREGGTPLDLYFTLTGRGEHDAPAQLLGDHYRRVDRAPIELDLSLDALPEELARGVFELNGPCSDDALIGTHVWYVLLAGRSDARVLYQEDYSGARVTRQTAPMVDDFHFSLCGHRGLSYAGVGWKLSTWAGYRTADYAPNGVAAGEVFTFIHWRDGITRGWATVVEGFSGSPSGRYALAALRSW